jgi:hypothetical protein
MPEEDVTLSQVLEAVNNRFSAMERKMVTKCPRYGAPVEAR